MNSRQLLEFQISDKILGVADSVNDVDRSDLQGMAEVMAKNIISDVAKFLKANDYDLEDLVS
jgi:hypothetical protein